MPTISKIRFVNVIYEKGNKRYNDSTFYYDGHNGVIVLENGAGKTVYIQAALQAILPHTEIDKRKVKNTFSLESEPMHVAIEWLICDKPRRHYAVTAATLFLQDGELKSYKYVYEYGTDDPNSIDHMPFTQQNQDGTQRASSRGEIWEYYEKMNKSFMTAKVYQVTKEFHAYIEQHLKIIPDEWRSIANINSEEGGIEAYFEGCNTTVQLVERLLIPSIEQAITEKEQVDFAQTFENHRENVKKYQELKQVIEESKKLQSRMDQYVQEMTKLHEDEKKHQQYLARAKSISILIDKKCRELGSKLEEVVRQEASYEAMHKELEKEKALCNLTDIHNELKEKEQEWLDIKDQFTMCDNAYHAKTLELTKLKIAKKQQEAHALAGEIKGLKRALEALNGDIGIQELAEALEENSGALHGVFAEWLTQYEKEEKQLLHQKERTEGERANTRLQKQTLEAGIKQKESKQVKLETLIEEAAKKMEALKRMLVGEEEVSDLSAKKVEWLEQMDQDEKQLVALDEKIRQDKKDKENLKQSIATLQQELSELEKRESKERVQQENIEHQESELVDEIKEQIPSLYAIDRLYTKKEQILESIFQKVQYAKQQKEDYLLEERKLSRFIDFYKGHGYFTSEPLLEGIIEKWQNQFEYLSSGTTYVTALAQGQLGVMEDYYSKYPGWVEAVITTDKEVEQLQEKLDKLQESITYPITILSLSEAKQIVLGNVKAGHKVYPLNWKHYLKTEIFHEELEANDKKVVEVQEERKQKEQEIGQLISLEKKMQDFFKVYPREVYTALCESLEQVKTSLMKNRQVLIQQQEREMELERRIEANQEDRERIKDILGDLNDKLLKVNECLNMEKEKLSNEELCYEIKALLEKDYSLLKQYERDLSILEGILLDCRQEITDLQDKCREIKGNKLYEEVKAVEIRKTTESLEVLQKEREAIKSSLASKQENRNALEMGIRQKTKQMETLYTEIDQERELMNYRDEISVHYGQVEEKKLEGLIKEIPILKKQREELESQVSKRRSSYDKKAGLYNNEKEKYEKDYEAVIKFIDHTELKREELAKRLSKMKVSEEKTAHYKKGLLEESKNWQSQKDLMIRKDERYKYLAENIPSIEFTEDERIELQYAIKKHVDMLIKDLETSLKAFEEQKEVLVHAREHFAQFCNTEIKDVKLRTLAYKGVEGEKSYEETLEWQNSLSKRIQVSIRYQEDAMVQQDQVMKQFVTHLYTHLTTIALELKQLYKKTKLKTEEGTTYFYDIDVPEWKEEESKLKIRNYINEMEQLIERKYENEILDQVDHEEIKKFISGKFKVTQLMNVFIGLDKISVRCRKAVSEGNISKKKFSWEESNAWSGGEKWSKNMALFLGILNYIAEKKQNIYSTEKVSRVVILDNPFGKASSDHVLEPVFFIAQQLGFQIIALTAHGEGDFIRKYFPIVYSCKLRKTKDDTTTLISAKQEINKAYFREVSPMTLLRLGQATQLELR